MIYHHAHIDDVPRHHRHVSARHTRHLMLHYAPRRYWLQGRMTSCHPVCTYCYVKVLAFLCPIAGHDRGYGSADLFGSDTRRQLPQVKSPYIYRSNKKGNCLGSVGRWGLLKQALRSFSALKPLKWAFYRGFRAGDSGIFVKNDPNCHSWRCQFGAQSGKTGSLACRPWAIASRFG